ncbi:hypothetical protein [Pseudomonas phage KP1]|uniref:Uncharacterized protein n=1 Tax=Pseudomonas phage KP1 TaxID=2562463 RepID=A0A6G5QB24_9CAUD|nr:hypothetical protein PM391_gp29 [Pseudomonas phage KP1]QBZ71739.1 hypothetical protein [Pseudomonas phage KP1]
MQLIQQFDATQFDPTQGVGGLPIGRHPVIVESSEVKANKNNDGGYLQLNLRIIDGPQQGTVGAYRLNLYHTNQQTIEIAHKQLSAVCHVTGVFQVQDSSQLHNIPFVVEVGPQKNDAQYTEIKKVFDINGNEPGKAPAQGAAQTQQAPAWGQQQQQAPQGGMNQQQQAATQPAWGQQQQAPANQQQAPSQTQQPAWGQQQQQAQVQQAQAQQNAAPAWGQQQQQAPQGGNATPWGQRQ